LPYSARAGRPTGSLGARSTGRCIRRCALGCARTWFPRRVPAETMPVENYTWRPAEEVRSVGEVSTPIAGANYGAARARGTFPPPGLDFKSTMVRKQARSPSGLHQTLLRISAMPSGCSKREDAEKPQKMFHRQSTLRGSFHRPDRTLWRTPRPIDCLRARERRRAAGDRTVQPTAAETG